MRSMYEVYQAATRAVRKGWTQKKLERGDDEDPCIVRSMLRELPTSLNASKTVLPVAIRKEIGRKLRLQPTYWFYRVMNGPSGQQRAVELWNDVPWRRQETVVKVLESLANDHKADWLRVQAAQQASKLAADLKTLEGLDFELNTTANDAQELSIA